MRKKSLGRVWHRWPVTTGLMVRLDPLLVQGMKKLLCHHRHRALRRSRHHEPSNPPICCVLGEPTWGSSFHPFRSQWMVVGIPDMSWVKMLARPLGLLSFRFCMRIAHPSNMVIGLAWLTHSWETFHTLQTCGGEWFAMQLR